MARPLPLLLLWPLLLGMPAHAGGHFDVDDAGTLDPGQCQYEVWGGRFGAGPAANAFHLGPACGVGPVEIDLDIDHLDAAGTRTNYLGPAVKWTFFGKETDAVFSAAGYLAASYDVTHGGRAGGQFAIPLSWHAIEPLWINLNLGYDWTPGTGNRSGRGGLQADWTLNDKVDLIAERFRSFGIWTTRAGLRFNLTPLLSIDVSGARAGGPERAWGFAVGVNQEFKGF